MKYLITGGAGFIGSHLTDLLISKGHEVTILDNLSTGSWENIAHLENNPNFTPVIDSILNENVLDRLVSLCDVVVHLAAAVGVQLIVNDPFHTIRTNVIGTDGVLKAACRYRKKTVVASTSEIYGKNSKIPFSEEDDTTSGPTTKQRWAYACTKAMDEFAAFACARTHQLPVIITRFFNTVGPRQTGQYGMVIPTLMKQALQGKDITVYGTGEQSRCFNNVSVAVDALDKLIHCDKAIGQVFNVGSDEQVSINELAQRIIKITGSSSKIIHVPYDQAYQEGFEDMMVRVPSIEKISSAIDYNLNKTLNDTLNEVKEHIQAQL
jgi:UDP-glucose 4-epimerase